MSRPRAQLGETENLRMPRVDVNGVVRERLTRRPRSARPIRKIGAGTFAGDLGIDMLWEIDLFGRVRRSVGAAAAELGSLEAVRNNVLLSLLSTVASAYIDVRGTQMRLGVAERNVAVQQQTLDLVLLLNKEGAATELRCRARAPSC
ncbi:MAG: TolC family protein [Proteobacteria bacterium]|nr:TolC family protein [Pseudomonadota bacterium]